MTAGEISQYAGLALAIIALLGHLKGYFSSGEKVLGADITTLKSNVDKLNDDISKHDKRIQAVEDEMDHLPDKESQHRIELSMSQMNGRMDVLAERLEPLAAVTVRLQQFLLEQARK